MRKNSISSTEKINNQFQFLYVIRAKEKKKIRFWFFDFWWNFHIKKLFEKNKFVRFPKLLIKNTQKKNKSYQNFAIIWCGWSEALCEVLENWKIFPGFKATSFSFFFFRLSFSLILFPHFCGFSHHFSNGFSDTLWV